MVLLVGKTPNLQKVLSNFLSFFWNFGHIWMLLEIYRTFSRGSAKLLFFVSTIVTLIVGAMTIPVSSTTTERTFSKLKLIKTSARNSMSDNRSSNLSLITIERDFSIDYENIVDAFAIQHKNSRIILK